MIRRRLYYSGKQKKHTVKFVYVNKDEIILYKTKNKQVGRKHDYKVYKKNHPVTPTKVETVLDLGFLGVRKNHPDQKSALPIKKKRNQDLTLEEKEYNDSF